MRHLNTHPIAVATSLGLAALTGAGCASGTSRSMAMAPLAFTFAEDGDLLVARTEAEGPAPVVTLSGDFRAGVPGYDIVGGNALLPSRPAPAGLIPLVNQLVSLPGVLGLPGQASSALATTTGPVTAALDRTVADLATAAPVLATAPPPSSLVNPVIGAAEPLLAPVTTITAAVEPAITSLVTQGGLLGAAPAPSAPPPIATALAGGGVTNLLAVLRRAP